MDAVIFLPRVHEAAKHPCVIMPMGIDQATDDYKKHSLFPMPLSFPSCGKSHSMSVALSSGNDVHSFAIVP